MLAKTNDQKMDESFLSARLVGKPFEIIFIPEEPRGPKNLSHLHIFDPELTGGEYHLLSVKFKTLVWFGGNRISLADDMVIQIYLCSFGRLSQTNQAPEQTESQMED